MYYHKDKDLTISRSHQAWDWGAYISISELHDLNGVSLGKVRNADGSDITYMFA